MMIHRKDCAWFAPVSDLPAAEELHEKLLSTFGDILPRREGRVRHLPEGDLQQGQACDYPA